MDTLGDPKCNNVTGPQADNACSYCCDNTNGNLPCNRNTIPTQLSTFDNSQESMTIYFRSLLLIQTNTVNKSKKFDNYFFYKLVTLCYTIQINGICV